jgi:quercetin dioxygenase-like cupin family protein
MEGEPRSKLRTTTVHLTGHNAEGQAIVYDSVNEDVRPYPGLRASGRVVYTTSKFPANLANDEDLRLHGEVRKNGQVGLVNPGGTVCRMVDFAPNNNAMMHRTQSLDYGVVLEGEMLMELDDGSVTSMVAGDIAIQRGTMHAWRNASSTEWARMLFFLQESEPLILKGATLNENLGQGSHVRTW